MESFIFIFGIVFLALGIFASGFIAGMGHRQRDSVRAVDDLFGCDKDTFSSDLPSILREIKGGGIADSECKLAEIEIIPDAPIIWKDNVVHGPDYIEYLGKISDLKNDA